MKFNQIILIVVGALLLYFGVRYAFFEKTEISTENWRISFDPKSKAPYGGHVFTELIKQKYGEEKLLRHQLDTLISKIESPNNLYLMFCHENYLSEQEQENILEFVKRGNSALIVSKTLYSTLMPSLDNESLISYYEEHDSIFNFSFENFKDTLSYKHYMRSNTKASIFYPSEFKLPNDSTFTNLAYENNNKSIFFSAEVDGGLIYQHVFPELFSNIASKQDFYLQHFNASMDNFDAEMVILDHPSFDVNHTPALSDSPIQYILKQKSLKWPYYLFLSTLLLFIIFRGKRKQRVIPIPEKNENTSIQYVDTLSNLFEQQNQNVKLVPHMKTIFMQRVKQKYYLSPDNEKFTQLLSKKSRIPENQINAILNYFENATTDRVFNDDQLIMLHQRLEDFYTNAE